MVFFFFFTLVTGPRRSLSLNLSDTRVYGRPFLSLSRARALSLSLSLSVSRSRSLLHTRTLAAGGECAAGPDIPLARPRGLHPLFLMCEATLFLMCEVTLFLMCEVTLFLMCEVTLFLMCEVTL